MATPTAGGLALLADDTALHALIECALTARARVPALRSFPLCQPLEGWERSFEQCVRHSERSGLQLPPRLTVEWREGRRDIESGTTIGTYDEATGKLLRDIVIVMNAAVMPELLEETAYHELRHAADIYDPVLRRLNRVDSEERAIRWAAAMMRPA